MNISRKIVLLVCVGLLTCLIMFAVAFGYLSSYYLYFDSGGYDLGGSDRGGGFAVRPVSE